MKDMWNERYSENGFAYGEAPNAYFKAQLQHLKPGRILCPAEGEGRNAVYAATQGWEVEAFDQSSAGNKKAASLARNHNVSINYQVADLTEVIYPEASFDAMVLIYAHFPPTLRKHFHQSLSKYIKPGGHLILEGFSINNLAVKNEDTVATNGPKMPEMLFTVDMIKDDFPDYDIIELKEELIHLDEGPYHQGEAVVVRFVGKKK